ncbi:MAG: hypothetical protein HOO06_10105 [Bdellovibrionaceae bacterium]|jgi:hypothetical protein|nr:hypothetical protein [Pseudobdellovibrionaceae bacterium]
MRTKKKQILYNTSASLLAVFLFHLILRFVSAKPYFAHDAGITIVPLSFITVALMSMFISFLIPKMKSYVFALVVFIASVPLTLFATFVIISTGELDILGDFLRSLAISIGLIPVYFFPGLIPLVFLSIVLELASRKNWLQ